jgi:hypothetical protein
MTVSNLLAGGLILGAVALMADHLSRRLGPRCLSRLILVRRIAAWHGAATLKPGVATARVEPTPAKIGPTEPAEIEIATGVITAAEVVAAEAYVAAAGG